MKYQKRIALSMFCTMGLGVCLLVCMANMVYARPVGVSSERKFYDKIDRKELAVALFYREDKEVNRSSAMKFQVARLKKMFDAVSKLYEFKQAEIEFLMVNVAKNKVQTLPNDFDVTQLPAILLFRDGRAVESADVSAEALAQEETLAKEEALAKMGKQGMADKTQSGTIARLVGFVSRENVIDFVNEYFSESIDDIMDEKEKARKQRAMDRAYWPYWGWPYGAAGYGYGYPYYGGAWYGYPYFDGLYRPYVGVGFGW